MKKKPKYYCSPDFVAHDGTVMYRVMKRVLIFPNAWMGNHALTENQARVAVAKLNNHKE